MSKQPNARREPYVRTFPAARLALPQFNIPYQFPFQFVVPDHKQLGSLWIDAKVTTTGAGMTTANVSQIFDKIRAFDENNKQTLDVDRFTLDMACVILSALRAQNQDPLGVLPRNTSLVRDPPNVATGATLYASWRIPITLPGKVIKVLIDTLNLTTTFGAGMTGGTLSLQVVPEWVDIDSDSVSKKEYTLYARQLASIVNVSYRGCEAVMLAASSEWSGIVSALQFGNEVWGSEQMLRDEAMTNDDLRGYAADGTGTATDTLPIKDPNLAANIFVVHNRQDIPFTTKVKLTSSQTIEAIVLGSQAVTEVPSVG